MTIAALKALFESGDKPTGADFANLIESTYGRDQVLQFNPVSGDLGISTSDGAGYNIVNIADMLDANLNFTYNNSTRQLTVTRNGVPIVLGPLDGIWTVTGSKANTSKWVGINKPVPGYPLHVGGNAMVDGKLTIVGDLFADHDLQIDNGLRFGGHAEQAERIANSISVSSDDPKALTTEQAVIAFVKQHSAHHVLLANLIATNYSTGGSSLATIQIDTFTPTVYDTSFTNSSSAFLVPSGMNGIYSLQVHIRVAPSNPHNNFFRLFARRDRSGTFLDIKLCESIIDGPEMVVSTNYEMEMIPGDRFSFLIQCHGTINNNLTGQVSVKRLPDPIL